MNKRHYEHTLPNIRGSLSNTYFSKDPPANKQVFKVKTVIEKALNKKQDVKKKRNTHPKL